jgi:hypothetical protein
MEKELVFGFVKILDIQNGWQLESFVNVIIKLKNKRDMYGLYGIYRTS